MPLWRDEVASPRAAHWALAVLGLVCALSFGRSFTGNGYLASLLPALAIGVLVALTLGRRALGLTFAGLMAGAWLTLPVLFAGHLDSGPFPTPSAMVESWRLVGEGVGGMLHEASPVHPEPRFHALLWVSGLVLGFLGGSWVVVGRPIGAVITALMIVGYAGQVGVGPNRDSYALAAVAVTIGFFLVEGRHRIASWGRERRGLPAWIGLPTLAAACVVALASPMVLGATHPLIDLQGGLQPRLVIIKPLADIRRQLEIDPPLEVLRVRAGAATYWRLTALDAYVGNEWVLEARPLEASNGPVPLPRPPTAGPTIEQEYSITSLLSPWLPAAFAPEAVDVPVPFEIDEGSSTLLLTRETVPGLEYRIVSRVPDRSLTVPEAGTPRHRPDGVERRFGAMAEQVIGTEGDPFQRAAALETWFRGFGYDEDVPGGHDVGRLERFLEERAGYCEQFAATMTLMLRGLGIPARVAVGFLPGALRDDEYLVTTNDAHAWVEANIAGRGWVPFDPTPGRGQPASPEAEFEQPVATPTPEPGDGGEGDPTPEPTPLPLPDPPGGFGPAGARIPVIPALLALLAGGGVPGAKAYRRSRRGRGDATERTLGAYDELVDTAADLGLRPLLTETPWEFWRRVSTADATGDVIAAAVTAMYAPRAPSDAEADAAWAGLRASVRTLRGRVPRWRRVVALYDPRTLLPGISALGRIAKPAKA